MFWTLFIALGLLASTSAQSNTEIYPRRVGKRCTGTISSLADVAAAQLCTTINISGFIVPAGSTFNLNPADGALISLNGDITFAFKNWNGPLMIIQVIRSTDRALSTVRFPPPEIRLPRPIAEDSFGTSGTPQKPGLMLRLKMGGRFSNVRILNSPVRAISIDGSGTGLVVDGVRVNDAAGSVTLPNGRLAGANTDVRPHINFGFDVSASNVIIQNSVVSNQDDCLAIKSGTNITFMNNSCTGGHGISIGSVESNILISGVTISNNVGAVQALRIKSDATAINATVSNVIFTNNRAAGTTFSGVLIDQSYPAILGTPGTGAIVSGVQFTGTNSIAVASSAHRVEVNCGSTASCPGTWNFAGLTVTGGTGSTIKNAVVSGGSF
ncbi:Glycoside hydrolase family 28 protein [Mycena kentingensis (nom. inval.)]|nr:Glycoside hydrolase family 28 protein [Mycena kentingensis (nom. inval.)]